VICRPLVFEIIPYGVIDAISRELAKHLGQGDGWQTAVGKTAKRFDLRPFQIEHVVRYHAPTVEE